MKKDKKNFLKELKEGLSKKDKIIPSKYHYDLLGSKYFEKITQQKEYYPTRKEKEILKKLSKKIPSIFTGNLSFVEIGSGAVDKIKILPKSLEVINRFAIIHLLIGMTLPFISTLLVLMYDIDRGKHNTHISDLGYVEEK